MSRCPTDGPVLKSILGLYRPAADCLLSLSLSLSLAVSTVYHFPSPPVCFSLPLFFTLTLSPIFSISPSPLVSNVNLFARSRSPSPSLPLLSLISWPHPAIFLLFPLASVSSHKSLCQLSRSTCPSVTLSLFASSFFPFFFCPPSNFLLSHSLLVFLLQAANGE